MSAKGLKPLAAPLAVVLLGLLLSFCAMEAPGGREWRPTEKRPYYEYGLARQGAKRPENHNLTPWLRLHGYRVDYDPGYYDETECSACHDEESCRDCHSTMKPANHNLAWNRRNHGFQASISREECLFCHTADSCQRCHEMEKPMSHGPAYARTHCVQCHLPVEDEGCGVCHRGAPAHFDVPLPGDAEHQPGADCARCHLGGPDRVRHMALDWSDCRACHR